MKYLIWGIVIFLSFGTGLFVQKNYENQKPETVAQELIAIEKKRFEAVSNHDQEFLNKLYANDFRGVAAFGLEVNKQSVASVSNPYFTNVKLELGDLEARVFGDTAVLTGSLVGKTESGEVVYESKYLHVYVKRGGNWQIVAGESSMVLQGFISKNVEYENTY